MSFSFLHIADIHLGRPFSDISVLTEKTDVCNYACKKSFEKIIELAIIKKVDFVLIAGDSFDSDEHDLNTKLIFINGLKKLADNGIKSYVICGNHDPVEHFKQYPSYFCFDEKYNEIINITGVTTEEFKKSYTPVDKVNIHAVSFEKDEYNNLVNDLPKLDSNTEKDFNIALIHCDLDKQDSKYAPVSREELRKLGYDYYALGHIHIPEIKEDKIVYAGSPQGRTKKETGEHGCYYIKVSDKTISELTFIPTDVVRFNTIDVDCAECKNKLNIFEKISKELLCSSEDIELSFFEINLYGVTESYKELVETDNILDEYNSIFTDHQKTEVYKINNYTTPIADEKELLQDKGIAGILMKKATDKKEVAINNIYDKISELHENIYKKLSLDSESKGFLSESLVTEKDKITEAAKNELKSVCSEIYNS